MKCMMTAILIIACFMMCMFSLTGCGSNELTGPPTVKLGRHECKECGMLVNEDRCSSALLVEDRGRREYWHFDDIGCMLDAERKHKDVVVLDRFVRDNATKAWTHAEHATFLMAHPKTLHTPMGTGIVAFTTRDDANAAQKEFGGEVHDYPSVTAARIAFLAKLFGTLEEK